MSIIYTGRFKGKVSTTSGSLNVRAQPNTGSTVVYSLDHNSTAHIYTGYYDTTNSSFARAWLLVYLNGTQGAPKGFVSAEYITWIPSYGNGECFDTYVVVASGQYVNLRKTPSPNANVIGHLHNGDPVLVLYAYDNPVSGWTHIATAQGTGWIKTEFLHTQG